MDQDAPNRDENALSSTSVGPAIAEAPFWHEHRLALLLGLTVVIAFVFVTVGMILYTTSGAAQLDLSRPGLKSVSNQVERDDKIEEYSSSGAVNKETIDEFIKLFDEQAKKAKAVDAFNGDPLNPEVLFAAPSAGAE